MTTTVTTAEAMRTALAATTGGVFSEQATNLLAALGYRSDYVPPRQPASVADFIAEYPAPNPGTQSENTCALRWTDVRHHPAPTLGVTDRPGYQDGRNRSWPAPERLVSQTIAVHAGKRVVRKPGVAVENEMWDHLGEDWHRTIPAGTVLATATLAGMAGVADVNLLTGHAVHDGSTEAGSAVGLGRLGSIPGAISVPAAGCGSSPT